ncbi:hypothetical protein UlMin_018892 [Ulmus minor]
MGKKRWLFFKKLRKEEESPSSSSPPLPTSSSWRLRWKFLFGSAFKWKRVNLKLSFFDDVLFRVVSVFEAIVLVITVGFFYLCCGCNF